MSENLQALAVYQGEVHTAMVRMRQSVRAALPDMISRIGTMIRL